MSNREMIGEMRDSRHIDGGLVPPATTPEWLQGLVRPLAFVLQTGADEP
jgi:hypothetical protein